MDDESLHTQTGNINQQQHPSNKTPATTNIITYTHQAALTSIHTPKKQQFCSFDSTFALPLSAELSCEVLFHVNISEKFCASVFVPILIHILLPLLELKDNKTHLKDIELFPRI